ncbi:hypothetical protein [Actinomadura madurae]|uniref:hypothetical protein n=1 Tax=Actinomadura madurae TaxID=1993 RepID=UPI0020D234A1|nr:hypothetical protein [Actinomadura madurae]MCP9949288.1 hypothetical protein [Actinomadura madurae]MCP9966042.1 hypothetical protein [Actinomadura madurae]MCQ0009943.1 hypothetical protein [Actinomadura madurae]MCQ0014732.1 hypothetical protein [Actinomadura madurae]
MRTERVENLVQVLILLLVGTMAGAASFTHVHDWTMANSPTGTGDWFGWANAVISELTPTAAGLEIRRRKRNHQSVAYPMTVLIAAASLSIAAQLAVAKPGPTGWLLAAVPALAFLALSKLVLSRTTPTQPASVLDIEHPTRADTATATADLPALEADHHALADNPAEPVPAHLMTSARMAAFTHQQNTGRPITTDGLAEHLGITTGQAAVLLRDLQAPTTPTASQHEGDRL